MLERNKIDGNDNVFIGGSLVINIDDIQSSDNKLYKVIQAKLNSIDKYVANHIKGIQPHNKTKVEKFKSSVVIESMGRLGIPITAGIKAISIAVNIIISSYDRGSVIKTSQVRGAITESLYGLDDEEYSCNDVERWAESYIRRYGTETLIKVVGDPAGEHLDEEDLVIKYLVKSLLPEVLMSISDEARKVDITKIASISMLRRMAKDVIDAVHSLNLYRIHYDVLFALVKEMALQPPHPWFAPRVRSYSHVNYDYEKYKKNYRKALSARSKGDKNRLIYALKETTHHSCSSILAYYSIYMGCGTLAPLYILIDIFQDLCREYTGDTEMLFRISEVENDFRNIGVSIRDFNALLRRIKKKIDIEKRKDDLAIESLFLDVKDLYEITTKLISSYIRKQRQKEMSKNRKDLTLDDIFLGFPFLEWEWHDKKEAFWVTHHYKTPIFSQVKTRILVVPLDRNNKELKEIIVSWIEEVRSNSFSCNFVFFVSRAEPISKNMLPSSDKNSIVNVACFSFEELIQASTEDNPWDILEKILVKRTKCV